MPSACRKWHTETLFNSLLLFKRGAEKKTALTIQCPRDWSPRSEKSYHLRCPSPLYKILSANECVLIQIYNENQNLENCNTEKSYFETNKQNKTTKPQNFVNMLSLKIQELPGTHDSLGSKNKVMQRKAGHWTQRPPCFRTVWKRWQPISFKAVSSPGDQSDWALELYAEGAACNESQCISWEGPQTLRKTVPSLRFILPDSRLFKPIQQAL